jgi:hypothetical protein
MNGALFNIRCMSIYKVNKSNFAWNGEIAALFWNITDHLYAPVESKYQCILSGKGNCEGNVEITKVGKEKLKKLFRMLINMKLCLVYLLLN